MPANRYEICPEFEDEDYERIVEWAAENCGARVEWSDKYYNCELGMRSIPELAVWALIWKNGVIGFDHIKENTDENERLARKTAALFIYLWCLGVSPPLADRLATHYVLNVEVRRVQ